MSPLIQDINDSLITPASFGSRIDFELGESQPSIINTFLPTDFGTKGYFDRRKKQIKEYINNLKDIPWTFNYLLPYSADLCQYLWAHREQDINLAQDIINILGEHNIKLTLYYMVMDYWSNFCGWPDLLVFDDNSFFFVEVKSSNDKLSEDQKNWLIGNNKYMNFRAKIFKIAKE